LYERERTGVARRLEVAMQDALYASLSSNLGMHWFTGGKGELTRTGNRHGGLAECPYNVYPTIDGHLSLICVGDPHWRALCRVMGREDLAQHERYHTLKLRVSHMDEVDEIIGTWTAGFDTQTLFSTLMAAKIPCAPVRGLEEVMEDRNMHERGTLTRIQHPEYGEIVVQRSPMRYDGVADIPLEPSHGLGDDTQAVLRRMTRLDAATLETIARAADAKR
jgi:CoA:oxalate CoA-transferase